MPGMITFRPTQEQGALQEQGAFIEDLISSGDYQNQSEVIREGLRLLQEQKAASSLNHLRQLIAEGEASPIMEGWDKDKFLSRMKQQHFEHE